MTPLRIGARGSDLAVWQARKVEELLRAAHPGLAVEIRTIRTGGDRDPHAPLGRGRGVGFFTKEIEEALLAGEIDVAVHSLKDLPTRLAPGLFLAATPVREDPRDVLVGRPGVVDSLDDLAPGIRVATSSPRRQGQLLACFPGLSLVSIRGNVPTRVERTRDADGPDAVILALAGLARLGLTHEVTAVLDLDTMLPAPGQGALGVETREDDEATRRLVAAIDDPEVRAATTAERAFLARIGAGCSVPAAALARPAEGGAIVLEGAIVAPDGTELYRDSRAGRPEAAEALGARLAGLLLDMGGRELLGKLGGGA